MIGNKRSGARGQTAMEFLMSKKRKFSMLKNPNGQAALEFLMTYGWVLLTITAILGAMVYFDVLNPSLLLPERCNLGYRLGCQDFIITPAQIRVSAYNSFPDDMVITSFNISSTVMQGSCNMTLFPENDLPLAAGQSQMFTMNCAALGTVLERGKAKFSTLTYYYLNASGPAYQFPLYGEIYAKIEK